MSNLFKNLLVSSPNGGGLFLLRGVDAHRLDSLNTTGLNVKGKRVLRALQPDRVAVLDDEGSELEPGRVSFHDVHDVLIDGSSTYLVGTAGNEVIQLDARKEELRRWIFTGEPDSWHVNCLARWNKRLVFSAFGQFEKHREYKGKTKGAGFVQDLDTGERLVVDLSQPHSLVEYGDHLLLANSENNEIAEYDQYGQLRRSKLLDGYTRGICVTDKAIYVGLSRTRNTEAGNIESATVVALDPSTWDELGRKTLPANEIYAIQSVEETDLADVLARLATYSAKRCGSLIDQLHRDIRRSRERPVAQSALHYYRLGDAIDFRQGGNAPLFITRGWATAQKAGTWSVSERPGLALELTEPVAGSLRLAVRARPLVAPGNEQISVRLIVNGNSAAEWTFDEPKMVDIMAVIPASEVRARPDLRIEFLIHEPRSPKELGLSGDERKLGLLLAELRLQPA